MEPEWLRDISGVVRLFTSRGITSKASRPRALIALNSELLSGSEAHGIMLGQLLRSVGFDVRVWTPQNSVYGLRDGAMDTRLMEAGLPSPEGAPYEPGGRFLAQPFEI